MFNTPLPSHTFSCHFFFHSDLYVLLGGVGVLVLLSVSSQRIYSLLFWRWPFLLSVSVWFPRATTWKNVLKSCGIPGRMDHHRPDGMSPLFRGSGNPQQGGTPSRVSLAPESFQGSGNCLIPLSLFGVECCMPVMG